MFNKLYIKIKEILKNEPILSYIIIILIMINFIRLPYYINGTGGIVPLDKKIIIENEYKNKGSFNIAYVSEYKANLYTLLYAWLNPNYDIIPKSEYLNTTDTDNTMNYRDNLELTSSLDNALYVSYIKAGEFISIESNDIYVTYILDGAITDIEVGDKILKVNDIPVLTKDDVSNIINTLNKDDDVIFDVYNKKDIKRHGKVLETDNYKYVGLYLTEDTKYKVDRNIKFKFDHNESGPSGGLMVALEIYNSINDVDITKGYTIAGTGTIDKMGNVGSVAGIKYKLRGASKAGAKVFLVPLDNLEEALYEKELNNYNINVVAVSTFNDALKYLDSL